MCAARTIFGVYVFRVVCDGQRDNPRPGASYLVNIAIGEDEGPSVYGECKHIEGGKVQEGTRHSEEVTTL